MIYPVRDLKPNQTQDMWLPVKPLLKQDKVRHNHLQHDQ